VFAEEEAALLVAAGASPPELEALVARRAAGEPLEHLLGWAEFCGLRVTVTAGVFVPRRRTGLLVREAVRAVRAREVVVDLCCGSGAVAAAVVASVPGVEMHASDVDPVATACAAVNLGDRGAVHTGDLYDALPDRLRRRVDLLVANAPYVPTEAIATMPPEARDHEPPVALDGGRDGLDVQRRIIAEARDWLSPRAHLLIETGRRQAAGTVAACLAAGLDARVVTDDDLDATVVVATPSVRLPE
jgi:release factor glutamine methyltransferase